MKKRRSRPNVPARVATARRPHAGPARTWAYLVCLLFVLVPGARPFAPLPPSAPEIAEPAPTTTARLRVRADADRIDAGAWQDGRLVAHGSGAPPIDLDLPRDVPLRVSVEAAGRARQVRTVLLHGDTDLIVELPAGGRIAGHVTDEDGARLAGVQIRVAAPGSELPWTATTADQGQFTIDTLPLEGPFDLVARAARRPEARHVVLPGQVDLEIRMVRASRLAGRVVSPDGSAAASAEVLVAGSGLWPGRTVRTEADGRFALEEVPPGIYEVRARLGDWVAEPRRGLSLDPGDQAFVTLSLVEGVVLVGIVIDSVDATPLRGATVTVASSSLETAPRTAQTGDDGRFELRGLLDSPHQVGAAREGYVPIQGLEWEPGRSLRITLDPGAVLAGIVMDEDRQPVEGARIEVVGDTTSAQPIALGPELSQARSLMQSLEGTMTGALEVIPGPVPALPVGPPIEAGALASASVAGFYSDAAGRFRVIGVPPGRVQLIASRQGLATTGTARLFVAAGQAREDLELVLPPSGTLRGRLVDAREHGVGGTPIEVRSDREPYPRIAFTQADGTFEVADVVGELMVTASPPGWPPVRTRVEVEPSQTAEVRLSLPSELSELRGRTVDERGFPLADVQVSVSSLRSDTPVHRTAWSARDGTFEVPGLPAPPWRLSAAHPERAPTRLDVIDSGREVQVSLGSGVRVSGQVVDDLSGEPVAGAEVALVRDDLPPERLEARTDAEGRYVLERARAGSWVAEVREPEHVPASVEVPIAPRRDLELDPVRLAPSGRLGGTVVDALGAPVARARVWVDGAPERFALTDGEGRFVLRGAPPGRTRLIAAHPAAGEGRSESLRVWAAQETTGLLVRLPERLDPTRAVDLAARRRGVAALVEDRGGHVHVATVIHESHAERAGVRAGDELVRVDGRPVETAAQAERLLRGPTGVPAVLEVVRGERRGVLVVEREAWAPE